MRGSEVSMGRIAMAVFVVVLLAVLAELVLAGEATPGAAGLVAQPTTLPAIKAIRIAPEKIEMAHGRDARKFLVFGETEDGQRVDLTGRATVKLDSPVATVGADGYVRPKAAGTAEAVVSFGELHATLPVAVKDVTIPAAGFVRDVEPILAKMGCNQGTCHGGQAGKEGFKLSLRGYDPDYDYAALTEELQGRRFDRVAPENSLMLLKPAGGVPHEGGKILKTDSEYYKILRQWIAEGTKSEDLNRRAVRIEVLPERIYLDQPGMSQQVVVIAHYADGTTRDVTAESFVTASNIEVAEVHENLVTGIRRGEGAILIRYEGNYATRPLMIMGDRTGYAWTETPEFNYIDAHVHEKLKQMKILPSGLCTDAEYIRRVSLDLTGQPADGEAVKKFLADPTPSREKREKLVDALLASDGFAAYWSNKWADLLQASSANLGPKALWAFKAWIRESVSDNKPYDQFVRELLLARGSSYTNPEVNYYRALKEPGKITEDVSQTFLGVRFNCNKCHDHPFERWTQKQYYEFGAYFGRVAFKKGTIGDEQIVYDNYAGGEVLHPKTNAAVAPKVPYGTADEVKPEDNHRRDAFVEWLTSAENPMFAQSYANRVWSYFFGLGIIDPVDDVRASNPASNAALLDALTADFVASEFDARKLMKTIVTSRTYQSSVASHKWNEDDKINFSHALPRRLSAEQLVDAVAVATGHRAQFRGLPVGTRAVDVPDAMAEGGMGTAEFLGLFGKPARTTACECERTNNFSLSHAINLVNGSTIGDAVSDPNNKIAAVVKAEKDNRKVIEELYYQILNRPPTEEEMGFVDLGEGEGRLAKAQDLAWALLNSPAFLYNR